jgi:hypothetical protein
MRSRLVFLALTALTALIGGGCGPDEPQPIDGDWFDNGSGPTISSFGYRFTSDGKWVILAPTTNNPGEYCEDKDRAEHGTYEWSGYILTLLPEPYGFKYTAAVGISGDTASVNWTCAVKPLMAATRWRRRDDVKVVDACPSW